MYKILVILSLILSLGLSGCGTQLVNQAIAQEPANATAPLLENLGTHHHPISTNSKPAQRYFDQGLILAYGFNHAEAERSFREAARLDPNCAMCYWGIAYVLGPNINAVMDGEAVMPAYAAIQKAIALSDHATDQEKAYIQALAKRYSLDPTADRKVLDAEYAQAVAELTKRYPEDLDAATMYAEALMDTTPWQYWTEDGQPKPATRQLLATLESVLQKDPNHPGANHLYIHAVEGSPHPEWGEPAADRLGNLVPGAGHLVHMPGHIYINIGRYHDAIIANQRALEADHAYITQCHKQGIYPVAYVPHNAHFGWAAAVLAGESQAAIDLARHTAGMVNAEQMLEAGYGTLQHYYSIPLYSLVKFGQWDEILAEPQPAAELKYPTGLWHFARGMAFRAKGQLKEANFELDQLKEIAADPTLETVTIWEINNTASLLKVATEVLAGEIAAQQKDYAQAIAHLQQAVILEDKLNEDEPPAWMPSTRQSLGAALLEANQPVAAEAVYRQDLQEYPNNGWSLYGLAQSLQAQNKTEEAKAVQAQFNESWQHSDITLTASRF
jgi:tetratricopeptide (TPR) repeat protein